MHTFKKYARYVLGGVLIIGGIIGLFLPFLQGIAMIIAGLLLLGNKYIKQKLKTVSLYLKNRINHR